MYIIGLDCGGTSSQALVAKDDGSVLGRGQGGPANFQVNGIEGVLSSVKDAITLALSKTELSLEVIKAAGVLLALGVSGASRQPEIQALTQAFQQEGFPAVVVNHDASIALLGALSGNDGVIVIAGTGSIAYGERAGETSRTGGWGYLLGDEGSAFWITLQALQLVMEGYDGRRDKDLTLINEVCRYFNLSGLELLIPTIYKNPLDRGLVGGFSKVVTALANEGHQACQTILAQAGRELGRLAVASLVKLDLHNVPGRVGACGGVFGAGSWILDPMQEEIWQQAPRQELVLPDFEPVVGAVLLGARHLNLDLEKTVVKLRYSLC